jgi:adenosylcobinamide-GDP ribazoletransferase
MTDKNAPLRQLWLAAVLLTRLPLPHLPAAAFSQGPRAVWAYPVIGAVVGVCGTLSGSIALALGLPVSITAVLTLAVMMILTGAMHEDGLADVFDGFWGGTTPERRLEIMRDSQIGTYGVLALVLVCALKISALAVLLESAPAALIAAAALSRSTMPVVMHKLAHARADGLSHSVGRPAGGVTLINVGVGVLFAVLCLGPAGLFALLIAGVTCVICAMVAQRKIGGQTGDVLGATQQISETAILLSCVALM